MTSEEQIRAVVRSVVAGLDAGDLSAAPEGVEDSQTGIRESDAQDDREATIAVGADHGGYALKEKLAFRLRERGYTVHDCGTHGPEAVDYPDLALAVAEEVAAGRCSWGIIVDGAGIGSAMAANKVPGVRAALCYDVSSARNSREHNHANVLTLGAQLIGEGLAQQIVEAWLSTPWAPGRHARRVEKIMDIERRYTSGEQR